MRPAAVLALLLLLLAGALLLHFGAGVRPGGPVSRPGSGDDPASWREHGAAVLEGRASGPAHGDAVAADPAPPAPRRRFHIEVRDRRTQEPIAGAAVLRFAEGIPPYGEPEHRATTAADGRCGFAVPLHPRGYVEIRAAGYATQRVRFRSLDPSLEGLRTVGHLIALPPGGSVRGRVVRKDGGPREATVWLVTQNGMSLCLFQHLLTGPGPVRTDADGRFVIHGLPLEWMCVAKVEAADGGLGASRAFLLTGEAATREGLEVPVTLPGAIRGRLVQSDGSPYDEGSLWHRNLNVRTDRVSDPTRRLKRGGTFCYERLPPGLYEVLASCTNLPMQPITAEPIRVLPGETTDLGDIPHGIGLEISGRIRLEGSDDIDAHDLDLKLFDETHAFWTSVDHDGTFRFRGLPPGRFRLELDGETRRLVAPLAVESGTDGLELRAVRASAVIRWRVVEPSGRPVSEFTTHVVDHGPPGSPVRQQDCGEVGAIDSAPLPPGRYDLLVETYDHAFWRRDDVLLKRGETLEVEAVLSPAPRLRRLVLHASGEPAGNALATLTYLADVPGGQVEEPLEDREREWCEADAQGFVDLCVTRPDLVLAVEAEGSGPIRCAVSDLPDGPIRLPAGTVVRGRLLDAQDRGLAYVPFRLDLPGRHTVIGRWGRTDAAGRFVIRDVAPGAWTLSILSLRNDVVMSRAVEVTEGGANLGAIRVPGN